MEKKEKIYFHDLTVALGGIVIIITMAWYFFVITNERAAIQEQIDKFGNDCIEFKFLKSSCDITQKSYDFSYEILCGDALMEQLEEVKERAYATNNLWEIIRLRRATLDIFTATNPNEITLAEISEGNQFYADSLNLKVKALFNIGALESGCFLNNNLLGKYAKCDFGNIEQILPEKKRGLAGEYYNIAKKRLDSRDYLGAIHYTAAAVAYQDSLSRAQYKDLLQQGENSLVCLGG